MIDASRNESQIPTSVMFFSVSFRSVEVDVLS
jgi:hypothetical protein